MNISNDGIKFIARYETADGEPNLTAIKSPEQPKNGKTKYEIGFGHNSDSYYTVTADSKITEEQAYAILEHDINEALSLVNNYLRKYSIAERINQHQFDALISFSFNVGTGWIYNGSYLKTLILSAGNCKGGGLRAVVNVEDALRVREKPDVKSRKLAILSGGDQVVVLSDKKYNNSWYRIRTESGIEGYCYDKYLILYRNSGSGKSLNNINKSEFTNEFLQYHHAGGRCFSALLARRGQELDMFLRNKYSTYDYRYYKKMNYKRPKCTEGKF